MMALVLSPCLYSHPWPSHCKWVEWLPSLNTGLSRWFALANGMLADLTQAKSWKGCLWLAPDTLDITMRISLGQPAGGCEKWGQTQNHPGHVQSFGSGNGQLTPQLCELVQRRSAELLSRSSSHPQTREQWTQHSLPATVCDCFLCSYCHNR